MQKLRSLLLIGLIGIFTLAGHAQQPPLPIAGVPNILWGMTPEQVQQIAPGVFAGQMLFYEQDWQTYPVSIQYFFVHGQLTHVTIIPRYAYDEAQATAAWQREYQALNAYFTKVYGQPYQQQPNMVIWRYDPTQTTSTLYQQGWHVRFERYRK